MRSHARFLYSFLAQFFLQTVVLKRECKNFGFEKILKIVSPTSFEFIAQTHARVPQSIPRWIFDHFEEVGLSKSLENIVKLGRPTFSKIVARPHACWLLYSFLTQIFLLCVVLKKEYKEAKLENKYCRICENFGLGS